MKRMKSGKPWVVLGKFNASSYRKPRFFENFDNAKRVAIAKIAPSSSCDSWQELPRYCDS